MPFALGKLDPGRTWRTTWILDDAYDHAAFLDAMTAANAAITSGTMPDDPPPHFAEVWAYMIEGDDTGLPRVPGTADPTPIEYRALTATERARIDSVTRRAIPGAAGGPTAVEHLTDEALLLAFRVAADLPDIPDPWASAVGPRPKRERDPRTGLMLIHSLIVDELVRMFDMGLPRQIGHLIVQRSKASADEFFRRGRLHVERGGVHRDDAKRPDAPVRLRPVPADETGAPGVSGPGAAGRERAGGEAVDASTGGAEGGPA